MLARKAQMASLSAVDPAWDISYAQFAPINAGDVSKATFTRSFSIFGQEGFPRGLFFKSDGTKMYVTGDIGDDVNEYTLSTAWNISTATYVQNFSVAGQQASPQGLFFKPDGTKMYVVGNVSATLTEYNLSTAWDISSASFVQNFSLSTQEAVPNGVFFKPDGTKMYITGENGDEVNEYSLSSAWNISTASYVQNFSVSTQELEPSGLFFKPDGTKMYIIGTAGDDVNEYSLSTAWDISTASYVRNFSVVSQDTNPRDLFFSPDMIYMYVMGSGASVHQYTLNQNFSVAAQETNPQGLFFKPDGTRMYVVGSVGADVNEYSLSSAWDISTASYVQNFSISAQETSPQGIFFKPDGTKMYIVGGSGDAVNEYTLSTAWNISTASYVQNFSTSAQEINPNGLFFKPDGTKMYIVGSNGDDVNEYDLSTAWNISTASYVQNFSVAAQETSPQGLFFKPDGTKMYIIGFAGDDVNEYSLSTAWDISTASYVKNFSVAAQETAPYEVFFKPDGLSFWIIGSTSDAVFQYNLGVE